MRLLIALLSLAAWAGEIGPANARVEAVVEKTGLMSGKRHVLRWERFSGRFTASPAAVELEVEAASVAVLDDWLNASKREDVRAETVGKNVLDAARHPRIRFTARALRGDPGAAFELPGELTIRGTTRPVTLTVRRDGAAYTGETRFPMSAFGIKPPRAAFGAVGTKDEMTVRFRVEPLP